MHRRFIVGIIASLGSFTLVFEATGAESPGPGAEGQSIGDRRASSPSPSALAYFNRGVAHSRLGNTDKAIANYTSAIQLDLTYASAYINRGVEYGNKRNYKLALRDETLAIQLKPKYANAYHNRGACYADIGQFDRAIANYSEAIRFNPRSASTFGNRARAYENLEKFDRAMADYDRVIQIAPKDSENYSERGNAYLAKDDYKAAVSSFRKALQLSPNNDYALGCLAWLMAICPEAPFRNGKEAIRMGMRACELSQWKEPSRIETLAAAYAESGDFDKAVKFQTQAINMKSEYGPVRKDVRERLALYRKHQPWRGKPGLAH